MNLIIINLLQPDLPFSCHICAKRFASAASLTYHKKRHDGDRPFACEICGKTYPIPSELRKHVRRVHGGVEETSFFLFFKNKNSIIDLCIKN